MGIDRLRFVLGASRLPDGMSNSDIGRKNQGLLLEMTRLQDYSNPCSMWLAIAPSKRQMTEKLPFPFSSGFREEE